MDIDTRQRVGKRFLIRSKLYCNDMRMRYEAKKTIIEADKGQKGTRGGQPREQNLGLLAFGRLVMDRKAVQFRKTYIRRRGSQNGGRRSRDAARGKQARQTRLKRTLMETLAFLAGAAAPLPLPLPLAAGAGAGSSSSSSRRRLLEPLAALAPFLGGAAGAGRGSSSGFSSKYSWRRSMMTARVPLTGRPCFLHSALSLTSKDQFKKLDEVY